MARNRTPTAILDARGSFIAQPSRARTEEPNNGEPLGEPPSRLCEAGQFLWKELEQDLQPGVALKSDRYAFESLVLLKLREREGTIMAADRGQLISLYSHFGLTPSSRSKVAVPAAPKSKLQEFLSKKSSAPALPEPPDSVN
jgi:hypothetical protein